MIRDLFRKNFSFVKNTPSVLYSLVLLVVIPLTIYLNTFFILGKFQNDIDKVSLSYSVLAQNIINLAAQNSLDDPQKLQELIGSIMSRNENVKQVEFLSKDQNDDKFKIVASSEESRVGKVADNQDAWNALSWNQEENIAFMSTDSERKERIWKLTQVFKDDKDQKIGLLSMAVSLDFSDKLIDSTISWSYLVLIVTVAIVLLLVINNTRVLGYAITVTRLRELDKMKDNFISTASHELRSPLTAIKGYLEFFDDKCRKSVDDEGKRYLDNVNLSVERLNSLVNDLLEVSRLEGNRVSFEIADFDPAPMIESSIEEMKSQAIQKKLELSYSPAPLPRIKADKDRTQQILINLISNAVKYTLKGKVEVLTDVKGKDLLITVSDTGVGISAEDLPGLFEKFHRIPNEETKTVIGTGLGLWIARDMARKMGGDITVESIKGVGSHFTLHMPLA